MLSSGNIRINATPPDDLDSTPHRGYTTLNTAMRRMATDGTGLLVIDRGLIEKRVARSLRHTVATAPNGYGPTGATGERRTQARRRGDRHRGERLARAGVEDPRARRGAPRTASVGGDGLELVRYIDRKQMLSIDDLLARTPEVAQVADVTPIAYDVLQSHGIGPDDWLALVSRIHALVAERPGLDGIVITHGTATLEETAYFLNLALKVKIPVVLVGAQRPEIPSTATAVSADGPLNLVNAVRTAGSAHARGMGVMIVLNDEIQAAREGTKTSTLRLQTFRSPVSRSSSDDPKTHSFRLTSRFDFGALGHADADGVVFYRAPLRRAGTLRIPNST